MCHMMADTEAELDAMADKIGISRQFKQTHPIRKPHYDVSKNKKRLAIQYGAIPVTAFKLVKIFPIGGKHVSKRAKRRNL